MGGGETVTKQTAIARPPEPGAFRETFTLGSACRDFARAARESFESGSVERVTRALEVAREHLGDDLETPVRVARLLVDKRSDAAVTSAVLLAPARRRGLISNEEIERRFGDEISGLVEAVQLVPSPGEDDNGACAALIKSAAADLRVLVARVAMRIIELELPTLTAPETIAALARNGRELLVPLADRIGLGVMRGMLEDACFKVLEPEAYRAVRDASAPIRQADELCLDLLVKKVALLLEQNEVEAKVEGRVKSLFGLHGKMQKTSLPLSAIMDRLGLRVIVSSVPTCYTVLGLIHSHFRPVPRTFDDYIGLPKENGYQSLHTCVYPVRSISMKPVEFQIRTQAMHLEAEFGAAAHWRYKSEVDTRGERDRQARWLKDLSVRQEQAESHADFARELSRLVYERTVIVFLRGGKQVRMPLCATARDLVQMVSDRASNIMTVIINAEPKPLDTPLKDGDTVEWDEETTARLRPPPAHASSSEEDAERVGRV